MPDFRKHSGEEIQKVLREKVGIEIPGNIVSYLESLDVDEQRSSIKLLIEGNLKAVRDKMDETNRLKGLKDEFRAHMRKRSVTGVNAAINLNDMMSGAVDLVGTPDVQFEIVNTCVDFFRKGKFEDAMMIKQKLGQNFDFTKIEGFSAWVMNSLRELMKQSSYSQAGSFYEVFKVEIDHSKDEVQHAIQVAFGLQFHNRSSSNLLELVYAFKETFDFFAFDGYGSLIGRMIFAKLRNSEFDEAVQMRNDLRGSNYDFSREVIDAYEYFTSRGQKDFVAKLNDIFGSEINFENALEQRRIDLARQPFRVATPVNPNVQSVAHVQSVAQCEELPVRASSDDSNITGVMEMADIDSLAAASKAEQVQEPSVELLIEKKSGPSNVEIFEKQQELIEYLHSGSVPEAKQVLSELGENYNPFESEDYLLAVKGLFLTLMKNIQPMLAMEVMNDLGGGKIDFSDEIKKTYLYHLSNGHKKMIQGIRKHFSGRIRFDASELDKCKKAVEQGYLKCKHEGRAADASWYRTIDDFTDVVDFDKLDLGPVGKDVELITDSTVEAQFLSVQQFPDGEFASTSPATEEALSRYYDEGPSVREIAKGGINKVLKTEKRAKGKFVKLLRKGNEKSLERAIQVYYDLVAKEIEVNDLSGPICNVLARLIKGQKYQYARYILDNFTNEGLKLEEKVLNWLFKVYADDAQHRTLINIDCELGNRFDFSKMSQYESILKKVLLEELKSEEYSNFPDLIISKYGDKCDFSGVLQQVFVYWLKKDCNKANAIRHKFGNEKAYEDLIKTEFRNYLIEGHAKKIREFRSVFGGSVDFNELTSNSFKASLQHVLGEDSEPSNQKDVTELDDFDDMVKKMFSNFMKVGLIDEAFVLRKDYGSKVDLKPLISHYFFEFLRNGMLEFAILIRDQHCSDIDFTEGSRYESTVKKIHTDHLLKGNFHEAEWFRNEFKFGKGVDFTDGVAEGFLKCLDEGDVIGVHEYFETFPDEIKKSFIKILEGGDVLMADKFKAAFTGKIEFRNILGYRSAVKRGFYRCLHSGSMAGALEIRKRYAGDTIDLSKEFGKELLLQLRKGLVLSANEIRDNFCDGFDIYTIPKYADAVKEGFLGCVKGGALESAVEIRRSYASDKISLEEEIRSVLFSNLEEGLVLEADAIREAFCLDTDISTFKDYKQVVKRGFLKQLASANLIAVIEMQKRYGEGIVFENSLGYIKAVKEGFYKSIVDYRDLDKADELREMFGKYVDLKDEIRKAYYYYLDDKNEADFSEEIHRKFGEGVDFSEQRTSAV